MCGAAVMALLPASIAGSSAGLAVARENLIAGLIAHLLIVIAEFAMPHSTDNAAYAARLITHGPFKLWFWGGAVFGGGILPLTMLILMPISLAPSAVLALLGLLAFEWCFVMAGQSVPNS